MFGYKVKIDQTCTDSYNSDEEWGNWSSDNSNYFKQVTKTDVYPDITSSLDIKEGELCFVVWAEWSSGDSFGTALDGNTEALAIFTDVQSVKEFKEKVLNSEGYGIKFTTSDGQIHDVRCPWTGYFETLSDIHIEQTIIKYNLN